MAFWSRWSKTLRTGPDPAAMTSPPPASGTPATPVLAAADRLVAALPDIALALNPPASVTQLQDVQTELGFPLPADIVELYLRHDGQPARSPGLLGGLPLLSLGEAMGGWRVWRSLAEDYATEIESMSEPPEAVREAYINAGWFPLCTDGGGNNLGVDCDPGPAGTRGQVINFGRDEEVKYAYAPSLTAFLTRLAELVEGGRAVVERDGEQVYWGIDDAQQQWPRYRDFTLDQRDEVADLTWYAALEPAWQERIGGPERLPDFLTATTFSSFPARDTTLARVTSLEPLGRATNLREVIIHTRVLDALTDLPALPRLTTLILATRSHAGIDRFPALAEYRVSKLAPAADLGPLSMAPNLVTLALLGVSHPDLSPLQGCSRLVSLDVRLADADQLQQVTRLSGLRELFVDLSDVDEPADRLDWSGLVGLERLSLHLGAAYTLDFLDQLPNLSRLTISGLVGVDVGAVGRMPRVESVTLRSPEGLVNVAEVAAATTLRNFSGGYPAFDVLKDLRPDLPFTSMEGEMTDEQQQQWSDWLDHRRTSSS